MADVANVLHFETIPLFIAISSSLFPYRPNSARMTAVWQ
jgi:hypothetical protein